MIQQEAHLGYHTGGRGVRDRYGAKAGYQRMKKLSELPPDGGPEAHLLGSAKGEFERGLRDEAPDDETDRAD